MKLKRLQFVFSTGEHIEFKAKHLSYEITLDWLLSSDERLEDAFSDLFFIKIERVLQMHAEQVQVTFSNKANAKYTSKSLIDSELMPFDRILREQDISEIRLIFTKGLIVNVNPTWEDHEDERLLENRSQRTVYDHQEGVLKLTIGNVS